MILSVAAIADFDSLDAVHELIAKLSWRDGRATAGAAARAVKHNEQAVMTDAAGRKLSATLLPVIADNSVIKAAARPRRFSPLIVSKTATGGYYGPHVDNAMMGAAEKRMRTDLSFTLFLTPDKSYEGGELVVHHAGLTQEIRGQAGELVIYPASSIHEVRPVSSGERIVCVGWIESLVADPAHRELLFDLENLRTSLRAAQPARSVELITLDKTIANLLRMWAVVP